MAIMGDEVNRLPTLAILLVAIGLVVGVGIVVLSNFADSTLVSTTATEERAIASQAGTLTNNNVTSVTAVTNQTATFSGLEEFTISEAGVISTTANITDGNYNITYVYGASDRATAEIVNTTTAIGDIPNTWLSLIVTVVVLTIILVLVIRSFGAMQR